MGPDDQNKDSSHFLLAPQFKKRAIRIGWRARATRSFRPTNVKSWQLTGWAAVSASTLKVSCSMKTERSIPQHCGRDAPPARMVIRWQTWAPSGKARLYGNVQAARRLPLSLDCASPLSLLLRLYLLCLCARPLLFLCSSSHTRVIPTPPTPLWAQTRAAWPQRETPPPPSRSARSPLLSSFVLYIRRICCIGIHPPLPQEMQVL